MIITYANGQTIEGVLLSRNDRTMRVAMRGGDNAEEFANVNGAWISEKLEPVQVRYEWQRQTRRQLVSVTDCVCSKELAARLIQSLLSGDEAEAPVVLPVQESSQDCNPFHPAA